MRLTSVRQKSYSGGMTNATEGNIRTTTITNYRGEKVRVIFRTVPTRLWSPAHCAEHNKQSEAAAKEEVRALKFEESQR